MPQLKLGAVSNQWLAEQGIRTVDELERAGVVETYRRIRAVQPRASLNLLWAMQAAVLGVDWRQLPSEIKEQLKDQL